MKMSLKNLSDIKTTFFVKLSPFLIFGAIIIMAYLTGKTIIEDEIKVVSIAGGILITFLFIKKPAYALGILISLGTNLFGAIPLTDLPSFPLGGLGRLFIPDILLLIFLCIAILKNVFRTKKTCRYEISLPLIMFIILSIIEGISSIINGADVHFVVQNLRPYAYYLIYFLIAYSFKDEQDLFLFVKTLVIIGVITAGVTYYQALTGKFIFIEASRYQPEFGLYQTLNTGASAMVLSFLMLFPLLVEGSLFSKYVFLTKPILAWIGGAIFIMMIRGVWFSMLAAMLVIISFYGKRILKMAIVLILTVGILFGGFSFIQRHFGTASVSEIVTKRVYSVGESYEGRTETMMFRLKYFLENPSLIGVGFKQTYALNDPTHVTLHNFFSDLTVRYGMSGILIFGWLLFVSFRKALYLSLKLTSSLQRSLAVGILVFNCQTFIYSYSSNTYFQAWGIIVIAASWAMLELLDRFNRQKQVIET